MTKAKEEQEKKSEFLDEKLSNLEKEHKEVTAKYQNASEDLNML